MGGKAFLLGYLGWNGEDLECGWRDSCHRGEEQARWWRMWRGGDVMGGVKVAGGSG